MVQSKISRRMILTSLGVTVALPWLESGRLLGVEETKEPPKRFGFMFWGDGIHPAQWWTKGSGQNLELGPAFTSLENIKDCLLYTSPSPRDATLSRMPSSA